MSLYNSQDVLRYKQHMLVRQELTQRRLQSYIRAKGYKPTDTKIINMQTAIVWIAEEIELASKLQREMEACSD